jgi:DNA primase
MSKLTIAIRRFDVASFLRNYSSANTYELESEVNLDCIFCYGKQKMYVNKLTKLWICHRCAEKGDLVDLVERVMGFDTWKAIEYIGQSKGRSGLLKLGTEESIPDKQVEIDYPPGFEKLGFPTTEESRRYWDYLKTRGVLASTTLEHGIGYCPRGKYRNRVVIPVFWFDKLVSRVARSLRDDVEKTKLTPRGNQQSSYLLNLDRLWGQEHLVLVEGPFDMLKITDLAVASFGKRISREQVNLLSRSRVRQVTLAYDSDAVADTWNAARTLSERFHVQIAELPEGEDPGSLPDIVTRQLIRDAKPYSREQHLLHRLAS